MYIYKTQLNNPTNITEQVEALNQIVADYCVPQICSEAQAYINLKMMLVT